MANEDNGLEIIRATNISSFFFMQRIRNGIERDIEKTKLNLYRKTKINIISKQNVNIS